MLSNYAYILQRALRIEDTLKGIAATDGSDNQRSEQNDADTTIGDDNSSDESKSPNSKKLRSTSPQQTPRQQCDHYGRSTTIKNK